jgi:hypothetical protein
MNEEYAGDGPRQEIRNNDDRHKEAPKKSLKSLFLAAENVIFSGKRR